MADGQLATTRKSMGRRPAFLLHLILLVAFLGAGGGPLRAQEKEFHWTQIEVQARLEADGSMTIRERQHYLFTGDYNGGARGFDLRMRQRLDFRGISRQAGDSWLPLAEGDLSAIDQFSWVDSSNLRWRSRLPGDPPFDRTALVYQLEYRISNVVHPQGELYAIDHDFLFPDREAVVERFDLDLEVDPAWQVRGEWQRHHSAGPLVPGEGYVVHLDLEWSGAGEAPVHRSARPFLPAVLLIVLGLGAGMAYLVRDFVRRQAALGRFEPVPALPAGQEKAWLDQYLLPLRAEEVGAFWDRKVGPAEVAALIARWVAEGKVRSRVEEKSGFLGLSKDKILHLELLETDRSSYDSYEQKLLDAFFFGGRHQVDTEAIRQHYKSSGFDPAGSLRKGLEDRLAARPGWEEKKERAPAKKPTLLLFLGGLASLFADFMIDPESAFFSFFFFFFPLIPLYIIAAILGFAFRGRVEKLGRAVFFLTLLPAGYFLWLSLFALIGPVQMDPTIAWSPGYFAILGYGLLLLGILRSVLNNASSRETAEGIATRKWLGGARNFLAEQLRRQEPGFSDAFFPYLLAFGLDKDVDRWFRSFGGAATTDAYRRPIPAGGYSGGGGGSTSGGSFTGGGGMFGGGGASASWAAAATSVASGVAAPSKSSSGGGSSGGSSSGGGSGGAW